MKKTTCLINETPISGFTRPATKALILAFTLMSLILAQEAAFAQNKNKSRLSAANAKLDSMLSERVQTSRLLNKYAKKEERNGKYSRRTSMGRLRSYTYDFQVGKFVCDPDEKHLLHPDTESCNPPYEIHEMDAVRIKIKNINPFIYTVNLYELQGDRISNENLTEGNSSRSLLIDFKALAPISVEKVGLASSTDTTLMKQILKTEKLERDIAILTKRLNESMVMKDTLIGRKDPRDSTQLETINNQIIALHDSLNHKEDKLFTLIQAKNAYKLSKNKLKGKEIELQKCLTELRQSAVAINKLIDAYNFLLYVIHSPTNDIKTIQTYLSASLPMDAPTLINTYSENASQVLRKIGEANLRIQELIELDADLVKLLENETDKDKMYVTRVPIYNLIQQNLTTFEKDYKAFDGNNLLGQIMFIRTMVDQSHFTIVYETHSIAENADYLKYNFEFDPKVLGNGLAQGASPSNLELAFQIHEGAKFDISSGFVLDYGLVDPSYYFDKTTDPTGAKVYVREGGNSGKVNPSLAVFLNGYKRTSTNFKLGGALGVGLSNNARFRLYAGPSLIVGRKERIVLSGGLSFGAISRLADGYETDMEFENTPNLPNDVPTVLDHYRFGLYFGVGFNLTGKENKGFMEKLKFN